MREIRWIVNVIIIVFILALFINKNATCEIEASSEDAVIPSLDYLKLGTTTLDDLLVTLNSKHVKYSQQKNNASFKIMHKYEDYLDAPNTITLSFKSRLFNNPAEFTLFFTPKSRLLYRVEIRTDGKKENFMEFFTRQYGKYNGYEDACYHWNSKPDSTGEVFHNVLFGPYAAYSPKITMFWTDWDRLYMKAVLEGSMKSGEGDPVILNKELPQVRIEIKKVSLVRDNVTDTITSNTLEVTVENKTEKQIVLPTINLNCCLYKGDTQVGYSCGITIWAEGLGYKETKTFESAPLDNEFDMVKIIAYMNIDKIKNAGLRSSIQDSNDPGETVIPIYKSEKLRIQ